MPKRPIIIISVLCVIALASGYWTGQGKREGDSNSAASSEIDEGINSGREPKSEKVKEPNFLKAGLVAFYPLDGHGNDLSGNVNHCKMHDVKEASDRFGKQGGSLFLMGKVAILKALMLSTSVLRKLQFPCGFIRQEDRIHFQFR